MTEHEAVLSYLLESGEASYAATLEVTVPKVFLLASASWVEARVQQIMLEFFRAVAGNHVQVAEFIRIGAMTRKYHTWFDWEGRTPAKFFAQFGADMKRRGKELYKHDVEFAGEYDAFLELGDLRNQLVHQNYAAFTLQKTVDEVRSLFLAADKFVDRLPDLLRQDVRPDDASSSSVDTGEV